jgi:hypothetical protein
MPVADLPSARRHLASERATTLKGRRIMPVTALARRGGSDDHANDHYERAGYVLVSYKDLPEFGWALEAALYEKPLRP